MYNTIIVGWWVNINNGKQISFIFIGAISYALLELRIKMISCLEINMVCEESDVLFIHFLLL